ncbi:MAG TPA: hypothetical protein VJ808_03400 [Gemmatimonadales bacterium]|nr:hypothetical protein [Gemmatimonadales bacterium]
MSPALRVALLLLLISPQYATAQGSSSIAGPISSPFITRYALVSEDWRMPSDTVSGEIRPTHWKEGAVIGGLSVGVGLALVGGALCRSSDNVRSCGGATVGGFLLGGVIGGIAGALIGGQFHKGPEP